MDVGISWIVVALLMCVGHTPWAMRWDLQELWVVSGGMGTSRTGGRIPEGQGWGLEVGSPRAVGSGWRGGIPKDWGKDP